MADEDHDDEVLSLELEKKVLERFNVLKEELGRTTVVSTAFYDKLAALNAGSIAIAVSVGVTILSKQELRHLSHGLLGLMPKSCRCFSRRMPREGVTAKSTLPRAHGLRDFTS
jgi:hypothetical protein